MNHHAKADCKKVTGEAAHTSELFIEMSGVIYMISVPESKSLWFNPDIFGMYKTITALTVLMVTSILEVQ